MPQGHADDAFLNDAAELLHERFEISHVTLQVVHEPFSQACDEFAGDGVGMCELLALSSSRPARLTFSLRTLASHGAIDGTSPDGWGVAFYQGEDVALFREAAPAGDSALVRYLETGGPITRLAISHIRRATQGAVTLANTQPFVRELGGRTHVFAHNGNLPGIWDSAAMAMGRYRPVGQTDSEHAFCALMERLGTLWDEASPPSLQARLSVLAAFAAGVACARPGQLPVCRWRHLVRAWPPAHPARQRPHRAAGAVDAAAALQAG